MSKWLIKACELGTSNLQTFLRYRLSLFKPTKTGNWSPDRNWFMSRSHKNAPGSKIWNRAGKGWRRLVKHAQWIKPTSFEEVCNTGIWYNPDLGARYQAAFAEGRASALHKGGLKKIQEVWDANQRRCLTWPEARTRFGHLGEEDKAGWGHLTREVSLAYDITLAGGPLPPSPLDWLGLFSPVDAHLPLLVIKSPS